MNCCAGCFSHPCLRTLVNDEGVSGCSCDYCGAKATTVLDIDQLCEPFRNLMTLYVAAGEAMVLAGLSPGGEPLIDLLQGDYDIFSDHLISGAEARRLLNDILQSSWDEVCRLQRDLPSKGKLVRSTIQKFTFCGKRGQADQIPAGQANLGGRGLLFVSDIENDFATLVRPARSSPVLGWRPIAAPYGSCL